MNFRRHRTIRTAAVPGATVHVLEPRTLLAATLAYDFTPGPQSSRVLAAPIPVGNGRVLVNAEPTVYAVDADNKAVPVLTDIQHAGGASDERPAREGWAFLDDGVVVFSARAWSGAGGVFIYRSDGTPQGTYKLADLNLEVGVDHLGVPDLVRYRDHVYFMARETSSPNSHGSELWRTDGTRQGTTLVKDIAPGAANSQWGNFPVIQPVMAVAGDRLYFRASPDSKTRQLWLTDGTEAGTQPVVDLPSPTFGEFAGVGDRLFFSAQPGSDPASLWTSNGTAEGTAAVSGSVTVPVNGAIVPFNGNAYFIGSQTGGVPNALFRSNGTEAGTVPTSPASLGAIGDWAVAGNRLYLACGRELWTTDGTPEGTVRLPVPENQPWPSSVSLAAVGGDLYFGASDVEHGQELWRTDGTPAGTGLVEDLYPGATASAPQGLTAVGDTLYFIATDPTSGKELRRLDPPAAATVVGRRVFYNHSGFDGNSIAANAADDGAIATDKNALPAAQDRLPGFDNVTSYDKGINGVMIDVANLPVIDALLDAEDFDFGGAGNPISIEVRPGAGAGGSDRVTLIWRDYNPLDASPLPQAVANGWLTVTVKANYHTGLAAPDVFSFGNLIGEVDGAAGAGGWRVNALDLGAVKKALNSTAGLLATTDVNRDGRVNALDLGLVKRNLNRGLSAPAPAPAALFGELKAAPLPRRPADEIL
jgi:ELWxxDGT repeat protein